jgi:hypothetical protein
VTIRFGVACFVASIAVYGGQIAAQDTDPPTPIEQALIDRACSMQALSPLDRETREECYRLRLITLRSDFGKNLSKVSAADRKKLDSTCGPAQQAARREAYLDCLSSELTAIQNRKRPRTAPAAATEAPAAVPTEVPAVAETPPAAETTASSSPLLMIGGGVVALAAVGGGVLLLARGRRARNACKNCGATANVSGDLCATCRHEAAEARRKAAAERTASARAEETQTLKRKELEEAMRLHMQQQTAQERQHQEELARKAAETARALEVEARRGHQASAEAQRRGGSEDPDAFDPHAILGVAKDASPDEIRAGYEEAKAKYDVSLVEDLGFEIKEHYKIKSKAVERAFQMLSQQS